MPARDYPAVVIAGPTGSGKSQLGATLAREMDGEIVSCDALQIYRGMDIGTAKPPADERETIPHHMLDLREPCESFSAGDYQHLGRAALHAVEERGRLPFVVGGTGFYLRALIDGLFAGTWRSEELRARLRKIAEHRGAPCLHRTLARADPVAARRIAPTDLSRIIRAYEVFVVSGKPMSWWHTQPTDRLKGFRWLKLALAWPRPTLYKRIDARVEEMFVRGFVDEVRGLLERFPRECQAFKAIGYRQIILHLEGSITLEQAVEDTKRESRRYAKRQLTWFSSDPEIVWLDGTLGKSRFIPQARSTVQAFLDA